MPYDFGTGGGGGMEPEGRSAWQYLRRILFSTSRTFLSPPHITCSPRNPCVKPICPGILAEQWTAPSTIPTASVLVLRVRGWPTLPARGQARRHVGRNARGPILHATCAGLAGRDATTSDLHVHSAALGASFAAIRRIPRQRRLGTSSWSSSPGRVDARVLTQR